MPRRLKELPRIPASMRESELPARTAPRIDITDPQRATCRNESVEPSVAKSKAEVELPNLHMPPNKLMLEPRRTWVRRDNEDPRFKKSNVEQPLLARNWLKMDKLLPSLA
jgi:hypothetical protein